MKTKIVLLVLCFGFCITNCSKSIEYSPEFIEQTSGRYLYSPDEVIEVYYENEKLYLDWRVSEKIKPTVLDQHTFFVADMYKKLRFVKHPKTNKHYLSIVDPKNEDVVTYDYLKLKKSENVPSGYLENGEYEKALLGYLEIKKQDPKSTLIDEGEFNSFGYNFLRKKEYQKAINIFKINVALYPESSNVYDSLADAYVRSGDSLQAYVNYQRALEINTENRTAKKFIEGYNKNKDSINNN